MRIIKNFGNGSSQFRGKLEELLNEDWYCNLQEIISYLKENNECHVKILEGDYKDSIAKFTIDEGFLGYSTTCLEPKRLYTREEIYNYQYYFSGRLSWKGKRNNPKFDILQNRCEVILDYSGEEELHKFDFKKVNKELLKLKVEDVNGNILNIGDKVIYINTRYGEGSSLCHGTIKSFKPYAKERRLSVIISNDFLSEESECNYPQTQIHLKEQ